MREVELRVRPVTRYILTEFVRDENEALGTSARQCKEIAEFSNEGNAERVAMNMAYMIANDQPTKDSGLFVDKLTTFDGRVITFD